MTRINIISPSELTDQHLVAEYREIEMVPAALERSLRTKSVYDILRNIPSEFTLNKGHVSFFYNKMAYLRERFELIVNEMNERGMNPSDERVDRVAERFAKQHALFQNNWTPTIRDASIIRERIEYRISQKPSWYRKTQSTS
jgi:deoxyribonuclease (pyrimidine dimer)